MCVSFSHYRFWLDTSLYSILLHQNCWQYKSLIFHWKPLSPSSLLFTEISKTYKPFYYQNIGKNIEEDLKKIKVSNFLNILKCQFLNNPVPHPQLWPDSATLSSCPTNLISFCDKLGGAVNEGKAACGIYPNFRKIFNTVSWNILVSKFRCYRLDG